MKPLLILVDLQAGYLRVPGMEPPAAVVTDRVQWLLRSCREIGIPVVHLRTGVAAGADAPRLRTGSGPRPQIGSPACEPPPELRERNDEFVIHKAGHSGFRDTELEALVRRLEVDTVVLAGVYLESCVRQSALDARECGLRVWLASDAVASDDPLHAAFTRRYLEERAVRFASVDRMIAQLDDSTATAAADSLRRRVDKAVSGAASFAAEWAASSQRTRIERVLALADCLERSARRLAHAITEDVGKPIRFSEVEASRSVEMVRAIVRHADSLRDECFASGATVRRCSLGTIAVVTPFNNPLYLALGKIVPAAVFGNTVVWKPAPEASGVARLLLDRLSESGWPEQLVTLLDGDGAAGECLLNHPQIDAITITGSSAAGCAAQVAAALRRIPLQAELGGNNAAIVCRDADLVGAADAIAAGAFDMSGQRCTANRRVIVDRQVLDPLLNLLVDATRRLRCGSPLDPRTRVGPLVSAARRRFVAGVVSRAASEGWTQLVPHGDSPVIDAVDADRWYPPTIVRCDDAGHEIVQEETFGPLLVVQAASDWEESIRLCNGVRQGLAAAVFTREIETVRRFLAEARAGILKVNQSTADAEVDVPFGGWKSSGIGPPEHGIFDIEFFTRPQTIYNPPRETRS